MDSLVPVPFPELPLDVLTAGKPVIHLVTITVIGLRERQTIHEPEKGRFTPIPYLEEHAARTVRSLDDRRPYPDFLPLRTLPRL